MGSTEEDEPPAKKPEPEQKKGKLVAPPEEWKASLDLDEYPQPPGSVHAVPGCPWLTCPPPQDAHLDISFKDILRPYHTYDKDVLPISGLYFLKRYTRKLRKKLGENRTEEIRLFDAAKCAYPTTTSWMAISITGPPFEDSRKRCTPIAPKFGSPVFRISVVVAQIINHDGKLSWGACINTTVNRACDPQGRFNREGADFEVVTYADVGKLESTRAKEQAIVLTVPLNQLIDLCAFDGDTDKIAGYRCNENVPEEAIQIT